MLSGQKHFLIFNKAKGWNLVITPARGTIGCTYLFCPEGNIDNSQGWEVQLCLHKRQDSLSIVKQNHLESEVISQEKDKN